MFQSLHFNRNGSIDLKRGRKTVHKNMARGAGAAGKALFLAFALDSAVSFEKDITALEILLCLEPVAYVLEVATGTDILAWLEAAKRAKPRDVWKTLSHIAIRQVVTFDSMTGGRGVTLGKTGFITHKRQKTDKIEIGSSWRAGGMTRKPFYSKDIKRWENEYSLSLTPIRKWAHLPVVVDSHIVGHETVIDGDFTNQAPLFDRASGILVDPKDLARDGHPMMRISTIHFERRSPASFVDIIIKGFIGDLLATTSPADQEAERAEVDRRLNDVKAGRVKLMISEEVARKRQTAAKTPKAAKKAVAVRRTK